MPSTTYNEMESIMAVKKYYDEATIVVTMTKTVTDVELITAVKSLMTKPP